MAFHLCSLQNGFKGVIAIQEATKARLRAKTEFCFRGREKRLAGNFAIFDDVEDFLGDPRHSRVVKAILEEMQVLAKNTHNFDKDYSFEIKWGAPVGWSSTDTYDVSVYHDAVLERRTFGWQGKANALFVQSHQFLAPITSTITIAFTLARLNGVPHATIRTIYPGHDVGDLIGDITKREGVVFFDWTHPGHEMPKRTRTTQVASV